MKWCKQCKREKPESDFLDLRRKRWKVTRCWGCASKNMRKWAQTQNVGKRPEDVVEAPD